MGTVLLATIGWSFVHGASRAKFVSPLYARELGLGRQPRRVRKLLDDFADRIMFETDVISNGAEFPHLNPKPEMFLCLFRFLETEDDYFDYAPTVIPPNGRWRICGIGLPGKILKNLYYNNAARLLYRRLIQHPARTEQSP